MKYALLSNKTTVVKQTIKVGDKTNKGIVSRVDPDDIIWIGDEIYFSSELKLIK